MKKLLVVLLFAFGSSLCTYCEGQTYISFDSLSSGMTSPGAYVLALAMKDSTLTSHLYAGGHFTIAGRNKAINIAEWADSIQFQPEVGKWKALGTGVDSDVCALQILHQYLYAGGKFDTAGGIAANHIARWDTALLTWDSLKGKLNGNVYSLCVYNNALYVGGDFTLINGDTLNRIAVWHDSAWAPVGKGFDTGAVYALAVSNDTLYAGGSFFKSNGTVVSHIAKLSGNKWASVGSGTNNTVYALADYERGLYVGGAFTQAGGNTAHYISSFDNRYAWQWLSLEPGTNDTVRALDAGFPVPVSINKHGVSQGLGGGSDLFIGGNFDSAGGYYSPHIADYYGLWGAIGTLNGPVFTLANPDYEGSLNNGIEGNYVGGEFLISQYGLKFTDTVNNIATFSVAIGSGVQSLNDKSNVVVYPNPGNGIFQLKITNEELGMNTTIEVYNVLGEEIYSQFSTFNSPLSINLSGQPNGIYFYRVRAEDGSLTGEGKLVIQK